MTKKSTQKHIGYAGIGIMTVIGFVLGLVFFGVLYAWYLSGFADTTSVMTTAVLLVIAIFAVWYIVLLFTKKKYAEAYLKSLWLGIGFVVALIIVSLIIGYLGLSVSIPTGA